MVREFNGVVVDTGTQGRGVCSQWPNLKQHTKSIIPRHKLFPLHIQYCIQLSDFCPHTLNHISLQTTSCQTFFDSVKGNTEFSAGSPTCTKSLRPTAAAASLFLRHVPTRSCSSNLTCTQLSSASHKQPPTSLQHLVMAKYHSILNLQIPLTRIIFDSVVLSAFSGYEWNTCTVLKLIILYDAVKQNSTVSIQRVPISKNTVIASEKAQRSVVSYLHIRGSKLPRERQQALDVIY